MATRRSYDTGGMLPDEEEYTAGWTDPAPPIKYVDPAPAPASQQSTNPYGPNPNGAQFGLPGTPTGQTWTDFINASNPGPYPDPDKSYDQYGYIYPGKSVTQAQANAQYQGAIDSGIDQAWVDDFLKRNPGDTNRIMEAYASERTGGQPSGGFEFNFGSGGGGNGGGGGGSNSALGAALQALWGGQANQDIINRRISNASDSLNRFRKSQNATNQAALANRGLIGSGPEHTAMDSLEGDIADRFANAVNEIYADESANADQRMMQALGLSTGRETNLADIDLRRELGLGQLDLSRTLGLGNLALGNLNAVNDYNLGLGSLGLQRDLGMANLENADLDRLIQLIRDWQNGSNSDAEGYF